MCGNRGESRARVTQHVARARAGSGSRAALLLCGVLAAQAGGAQVPANSFPNAFPSRPLRIISPYPPGGLGDIFPRALAAAAVDGFGQQIIIENRPGATQIIGAQAAAKATPDGYTLFFGSTWW
jgi:tripartite-type tricarboxylate transporter receptor subunit TctC